MAATTPYGPNDYTAVSNFRPYELPINDIFKGLTAQNKFWDEGAAKVKAVHDNALDLQLTLAPNKEIRDKYMADADKQLTKLSTMDLSNPSIQRQGFNLYKPLFKDEGVMYDDLATRHYQKVRDDAMMYRNKNNGKEYSDINFQYAMQGYSDFTKATDRMAGKSAYENRKEYTPYYDYTEDFAKALKDCHPSSIHTEGPYMGSDGKSTTGYMHEVYAKSLSAAQAKGCLESGLSPNAQRQLQIEGAVAYHGNATVLGSDVADYLSGVNDNLSQQLQELSANKAALIKNPGKLTPEQLKATLDQYDKSMRAVTNEMTTTNHTMDKINKGDLTDVLNNFENYAGTVYSYRKLYKKALSSSYSDTKDIYKADPVQMSKIKFSNDVYLHNLDNNFAWSLEMQKEKHSTELKMLDLMYGQNGSKGLGSGMDMYRDPRTGDIIINPSLEPVTPNYTEKPTEDDKVYGKLTGKVDDLKKADNDNNLTVYNKLIARAEGERGKAFRETLLKGFNMGTTDDEWNRFKSRTANNIFNIGGKDGGIQETSWFKAYIKANPKDEDINGWAAQKTVIDAGLGTINRKLEIGEQEVARRLGNIDISSIIKKNIEGISPINIDGTIISGQDIQNAIDGNQSKIKITWNAPTAYSGGTGGNGYDKLTRPVITLNGKDITSTIYSRYKTISDRNDKATEKINKTRMEVYNNLGFDKEPWFFTPHNEKDPFVQTVRALFPVDDKGNQRDINIVQSDFSGGVRISFPTDISESSIIENLRSAGLGKNVEVKDHIATIKGTKFNLIQQAINNPILADAAYQLQSIGSTRAFNIAQSGQKIPNSDIKVPVMISGDQKMMTIETHKNGNVPEFRVYMEGATDPRPWIIASNPYELFEKIGRSPIDLNKPLR